MFTLGYKEAIVNDTSHYAATAYASNGSVLASDGAIDLLVIDRFGTFKKSQLVSGSIVAAAAGSVGKARLAVPTAASIGLASTDTNVSVNFLLRVKTSRDESGYANDFIERGRPFVFNIMLDGGDSAITVASKINDAMTGYESAFITTDLSGGSLPFDWENNGAGGIIFTLKESHLSFAPSVTFVKKWATYGLTLSATDITGATFTNLSGTVAVTAGSATVTGSSTSFVTKAAVGSIIKIEGYYYQIKSVTSDTILTLDEAAKATASGKTASVAAVTGGWAGDLVFGGVEPIDGKYLEENVSMAAGDNLNVYGPNSGEVPIIGNLYVTAKWSMKAVDGTGIGAQFAPHANLGVGSTNLGLGDRVMDFIMYFNAAVFTSTSATAVGTQVQKLAKFFA